MLSSLHFSEGFDFIHYSRNDINWSLYTLVYSVLTSLFVTNRCILHFKKMKHCRPRNHASRSWEDWKSITLTYEPKFSKSLLFVTKSCIYISKKSVPVRHRTHNFLLLKLASILNFAMTERSQAFGENPPLLTFTAYSNIGFVRCWSRDCPRRRRSTLWQISLVAVAI